MTTEAVLLVAAGFALGAAGGSFFAACVDRRLRGLTPKNPPRSECPGCLRQLTWWENIPLVSYCLLKGACRSCHWKIPQWYFFYEVTGALLGASGSLALVLLIKMSY
jgi:leader peptidase (prepilin peptidase)/N-methyltransferase